MTRTVCAVPEAIAWVVGGLAFLAGAVLVAQRRRWI